VGRRIKYGARQGQKGLGSVKEKVVKSSDNFKLRAVHIISLMSEGYTREQIADFLNIPVSSISSYLRYSDIEGHSDELRMRGMAVLRHMNDGKEIEEIAAMFNVTVELIKLDIRRTKRAGKWKPNK
jgi:DNA-binding NarL/FixJ family response regulator